VTSPGSAILSPILFKLSERSVCLCSTDMGKYTLNLTRDSSNPVLLTYSIVFIINVLKKEEERVVSLFIVLKALQ
jgi:hypothetical protein